MAINSLQLKKFCQQEVTLESTNSLKRHNQTLQQLFRLKYDGFNGFVVQNCNKIVISIFLPLKSISPPKKTWPPCIALITKFSGFSQYLSVHVLHLINEKIHEQRAFATENIHHYESQITLCLGRALYEVNKVLNELCWILKLLRDPHKNYSQVWKVSL